MNTWKIVVSIIVGLFALFAQFAGVVWVAHDVKVKAENNEKKIDKVVTEQASQSTAVITSSVRIEAMQKQVDRIEKTTEKIWDKLQ